MIQLIQYKQLKPTFATTMKQKKKIAVLYPEYRKLSQEVKKKRIDQAEQQQIYRKPNPQGISQFDEYSFIQFRVIEEGKQIKLATYRQHSEGEAIGLIFMFHGLNSHIGHGAHLAKYFSKEGLITVGFDHRGFGRSQGRQGYVDNLQSHLTDSRKFIDQVMPLYPNLPKFVLGLSMGGLTSYQLTLQNPHLFDGAILMAPAIKNSFGAKVVKLTKILQAILPDKTRLAKPVYGKASKNPEITEFVKLDKYAFADRMPLSTIEMIVSAMDQAPKTFHKYKSPFMIIQGGLDKLVNPECAFELYDQSQTLPADKQLLFYENMWHDVWHEEEIHDILPKVATWIKGRIQLKQNTQKPLSKPNTNHHQAKQSQNQQQKHQSS